MSGPDMLGQYSIQEIFERAFVDAPIGMTTLSTDGTYELVNQAACDMLGYRREELIGRRWQDVVHPDDRTKAEAWLREAEESRRLTARSDELRYCRKDGAILYIVKTASLLPSADGTTRGTVCEFVDVSERHRYEEELRHRSLHDHLTGLPNRALLRDRLHHALVRRDRTGESVALVLLDVDEFKRVNDSLGHGAGDRVLVETAHRLAAAVRGNDTICRLGGDEFVVLCEALRPELAEPVALELAGRLLDAVAGEPYRVGDHEVSLRASAGVAIAEGQDTGTATGVEAAAQRLPASADAAMYRAKRRGGGTVELAGDEAWSGGHRLAMENDLRAALAGEPGLWLAYQPIVDLDAGTVAGFEALLRWDRPGHGPVSPVEVIPLAEESDLIVELGEWVLTQAVSDLGRWSGAGMPYVAINLGARQFTSETLVPQLRDRLTEHDVDPRRITLEITEGVAMGDAETALATMRELKDVGVRIAIDDFGTGFSSLEYLKRFPADALKIDRVFVSDVDRPSGDRAIVRAVISMADALGLDVIAEGVETSEQRSALTDMGCRRAQGYLFARPAPISDLLH